MARLAVAYHDDFKKHDAGPDHPERAERVCEILQTIKKAPWADRLDYVEPRVATQEDVALVHDIRYAEAMRRLCDAGGQYLPAMGAAVGKESYPAALRAVGAGLTLGDGVMDGSWKLGFGLVRPPGHHAIYARPWGCCIFNNIAILAEYLIQKHKLERIGILDFDVHHGNGTEQAFWASKKVLFCSIHQTSYFPSDTGDWHDTGEGEGKGYTINIPLPPKTTDRPFIDALDRHAIPVFEEYKPQIMLVSAGFDGHWRDIQSGLKLTELVYGEIARRAKAIANIAGEGRVITMLEGGYDSEGNSASVLEYFGAMLED